MLERQVTIVNRRGLHARAAAKIVTLCERFAAAEVTVTAEGRTTPAASIMGLMMLGAGLGEVLNLQAEGDDAAQALAALADLITAGFNEGD